MANNVKLTDRNGNEYKIGDTFQRCDNNALRVVESIEPGLIQSAYGGTKEFRRHEIIRRADGSDPRVKKEENLGSVTIGNKIMTHSIGKGIEERVAEAAPLKKSETAELGAIIASFCIALCYRAPTPAQRFLTFSHLVNDFRVNYPKIKFTTDFNQTYAFVWLECDTLGTEARVALTADAIAWEKRISTVVNDFITELGSRRTF